jgi:hypothetical protein
MVMLADTPTQIVRLTQKMDEFGDMKVHTFSGVIDAGFQDGIYSITVSTVGKKRVHRFATAEISTVTEDY